MNTMRSVFLMSVAVFVGCGGSEKPSEMECAERLSSKAIVCGGDVVGTWKLDSSSCSFLYLASLEMNADWVIKFDSAGNYTSTATGTNFVYAVSPSFFARDAGTSPSNCDDLNRLATSMGGTCQVGSDSICNCSYPASTLIQSGTYSTSGTKLTLPLNQTMGTQTGEFCVRDGKLRFAKGGVGNFSPALEFTKQ